MKKVFVCSGMGLAKDETINQEAILLGKMLSETPNIIYAQGGSVQGLMGLTLKEFIKKSKNVEFYIPDRYYEYDKAELDGVMEDKNFRHCITKGEAGRLIELSKCDEVVVFPGGTGTLEEVLFCNENKRSGEFKGNIYIVNINGYFDNFLNFIEKAISENLAKISAIKFEVVNSVKELKFLKKDCTKQ